MALPFLSTYWVQALGPGLSIAAIHLFPDHRKISISISFIESGHAISTLNGQSVKQPLTEV